MSEYEGMTDIPLLAAEANYQRSVDIEALAESLCKAQAQIEGAMKDTLNPHFNRKYADLASVWEACRKPLTDNGLSVLQPVRSTGKKVSVTTLLMHKSGQWIDCSLELEAVQNTPQAVGSAITYGRRYGLASMVGIAPEDDDGNAASGSGSKEAAQAVAKQKIADLQAQAKPAAIDDSDIPANLGGTFQPTPPPVDRVAQAKERVKPSKVPTFQEMIDVFAHIKAGYVEINMEHEYYSVLGDRSRLTSRLACSFSRACIRCHR
jgi:hypothetical protein